jgi:hypothetical protein
LTTQADTKIGAKGVNDNKAEEVSAAAGIADSQRDHRSARMRAILDAYHAYSEHLEEKPRGQEGARPNAPGGEPKAFGGIRLGDESHEEFIEVWLKDPTASTLRFMARELAYQSLAAGGREEIGRLAGVAKGDELAVVNGWLDGIGGCGS